MAKDLEHLPEMPVSPQNNLPNKYLFFLPDSSKDLLSLLLSLFNLALGKGGGGGLLLTHNFLHIPLLKYLFYASMAGTLFCSLNFISLVHKLMIVVL
jgi:hypothetical protein